MVRRRACVAAAAIVPLLACAPAPALAKSKSGEIANPGRVQASVIGCTSASQDECGGSLELNGEFYPFGTGNLSGTAARNGVLSHTRVSFGAAATDPETQGPFQLSMQTLTAGAIKAAFVSAGSPLGVGNRYGVDFEFKVPVYIHLTGSEPNPDGGPGPGVGGDCTIGSPASPLTAEFLPTLSSFFSGGSGVPYDQQTGIADLTASALSLPGVQNCAGQESALDEQLGIPGPGSIQIILRFSPPVVSAAYRAAHPLR